MKRIYIMSGEDIVLKEDDIKEIRNSRSDWNYKKTIIDESNKDYINSIINDSYMYLTTIDMFNLNNKILHIVVDNAKIAIEFFLELVENIGENILIIDVRSSDIRSITSNSIYKKKSSLVELKKYTKIEEKNRKIVVNDILNYFKKYNIQFESKEVEKFCAIYIYENSDYSYTEIRQQIEQLRYLSEKILTKNDIYDVLTNSFNGNFFVIINKIFESNDKKNLMDILDFNLSIFNQSEYISFLNIFTYMLKDYIRYINSAKCKSVSNYYQFKNSKFKIEEPSKMLLEISNINFTLRISTKDIKEDLIICILNHFNEK